jgi:hypothetical protein
MQEPLQKPFLKRSFDLDDIKHDGTISGSFLIRRASLNGYNLRRSARQAR